MLARGHGPEHPASMRPRPSRPGKEADVPAAVLAAVLASMRPRPSRPGKVVVADGRPLDARTLQ